uniref:Uncharacterized protein n=1 Tax=Chromera velia CCMP2878 TaxID=1169474 RepID=A0A0G4HM68_9ALVE|eukprot:Cvel_7441.t1-p1 / transcript=Cvel_7441.t1 / gene=Cvel_7441 / organism=Chromera_velia_CCMP2878 / gene_product=hypothetical protein / transcript_product=hypothetical protein / location=Cvel_scaffold389:8377-9093(+) / protein_length=239 / sequence_SO=supercontig / SO=protein_coding / is_pseudo=false
MGMHFRLLFITASALLGVCRSTRLRLGQGERGAVPVFDDSSFGDGREFFISYSRPIKSAESLTAYNKVCFGDPCKKQLEANVEWQCEALPMSNAFTASFNLLKFEAGRLQSQEKTSMRVVNWCYAPSPRPGLTWTDTSTEFVDVTLKTYPYDLSKEANTANKHDWEDYFFTCAGCDAREVLYLLNSKRRQGDLDATGVVKITQAHHSLQKNLSGEPLAASGFRDLGGDGEGGYAGFAKA